MNKYDGIDEAIVQANDIPVHYKIGGHHKGLIHDSLIASAEDHSVFSPVKENTSLQIGKVGSAFIHEQSTVRFEDDSRTSRKQFLTQEVLLTIPNRKKPRMGYTTKSIHTTQMRFGFNKKNDHVISGSLSNRNGSVQEKSSKLKQQTFKTSSLNREGRSDKSGILSETSEAKSLGVVNETSPEIQERLMTWKRKQEARFEEERKVLEEGKQKLLEEKIR